jgi:hypothetical protein
MGKLGAFVKMGNFHAFQRMLLIVNLVSMVNIGKIRINMNLGKIREISREKPDCHVAIFINPYL